MIKVLIVDDDAIARTNLKTMIDWGKYGFEIIGEAVNGSNAIQIIDNCVPDIVITDMNMPVMDGVALIEYLESNHHRIKVIALSGYDDFDYVRQSMKRGTVDYLLKHKLDPELLLSTLRITQKVISNDKETIEHIQKLQEQLTVGRSIMKQDFIRQLVLGGTSGIEEIKEKINELGISIGSRNLAVVVAEIDDFTFIKDRFNVKEINKLVSSIVDMSTDVLNDMGKGVVSHIEAGKFVMILSFENMRSDLYINNHAIATIERVKTSIKRYLNITACFSLSRQFNDITEINKYYKEAETALKDKFFKGKDKIIRESATVHISNEFLNLDINDEKRIITALKAVDRQKVKECIQGIFEKVLINRASQKSIQMICAELINIINRVARESAIDAKMIYSDEDIPYNEMKKYETITEVEQWIINIYGKLLSLLEVSNINFNFTEPTQKAMEFILRNFDKNISLNDAALYVGVNSSYLSRVFKEDCGKGFTEYLNLIRVEHAKFLIENGDSKLKEIIKSVGFNNYTYFFKVFKDTLGMTPLEYEGNCKANNQ